MEPEFTNDSKRRNAGCINSRILLKRRIGEEKENYAAKGAAGKTIAARGAAEKTTDTDGGRSTAAFWQDVLAF